LERDTGTTSRAWEEARMNGLEVRRPGNALKLMCVWKLRTDVNARIEHPPAVTSVTAPRSIRASPCRGEFLYPLRLTTGSRPSQSVPARDYPACAAALQAAAGVTEWEASPCGEVPAVLSAAAGRWNDEVNVRGHVTCYKA